MNAILAKQLMSLDQGQQPKQAVFHIGSTLLEALLANTKNPEEVTSFEEVLTNLSNLENKSINSINAIDQHLHTDNNTIDPLLTLNETTFKDSNSSFVQQISNDNIVQSDMGANNPINPIVDITLAIETLPLAPNSQIVSTQPTLIQTTLTQIISPQLIQKPSLQTLESESYSNPKNIALKNNNSLAMKSSDPPTNIIVSNVIVEEPKESNDGNLKSITIVNINKADYNTLPITPVIPAIYHNEELTAVQLSEVIKFDKPLFSHIHLNKQDIAANLPSKSIEPPNLSITEQELPKYKFWHDVKHDDSLIVEDGFEDNIASNSKQAHPQNLLQGIDFHLKRPLANLYQISKHSPEIHFDKTNNIVEQVSMRVINAVKSGQSKIYAELEPKELGKIEISMEFNSKTGKQIIEVLSEKFTTFDILQRSSRELQSHLKELGVMSDSSSLNFGLKDSNQQHSQQHDQQQHNHHNKFLFDQEEAFAAHLPHEVHNFDLLYVHNSWFANSNINILV